MNASHLLKILDGHRRETGGKAGPRRGLWKVGLLTLLMGCTPDAAVTPTATPSPTPAWQPPVFEGDGLPPSEGTDHATGDTTNDTGGNGGDNGEEELPPITVVNGLFAYSIDEQGQYSGSTILMNVTAGCDNLFGAVGKISPDGLYFSVYPGSLPQGVTAPDWVHTYEVCGDSPCLTGYALVAGEYQELESPVWLNISHYDSHYVTVDWSTPYSSGEALTFYNCGDVKIWNP